MTHEFKDPIDPAALKQALAGSLFGTNILYYDSLESTNSLARSLASRGAPEGTLLIADEQSAGRGRMGRTWLSRKGANLLFSLLLRPALSPEHLFQLTMILAVSAAESLQKGTALPVKIKWPNDLYSGGRKLAGMLTESGIKDKVVEYVVLGMGLNVHWRPEGDHELRGPATSLDLETGRTQQRADILVGILEEFEAGYRRFLAGDSENCYRKWNELSLILGANVIVESEQDSVCGKALRIDREGALILEEENGIRRRIISGDVSLRMGGGQPPGERHTGNEAGSNPT